MYRRHQGPPQPQPQQRQGGMRSPGITPTRRPTAAVKPRLARQDDDPRATQNPGTRHRSVAASRQQNRHTWATLPVPRKGPQAGEVRARSTAPCGAAHLAQSCLPGYPGPASRKGPTGPTLRANPCPEVTDQDCRFPLPTLIYRLEAPNLGDLMRRWVQSVSKQGLQRTAPAAG